jgi:tRNA (mo5U34)-methyltransferase
MTDASPQRHDADLRDEIEALGPWFQNLDLRGIATAPEHFLGDYPRVKWQRFADALPHDLAGRTVLDIGCNAGYYCFEMKRRGAARVVGVDHDARYLAQARLSAYRVHELGERFDLVLFMGAFYHLRHPLLVLDLIHEHLVNDLFVFQTMLRGSSEVASIARDYPFEARDHFDAPGYPRMHFVEHRYAHDPTNWWVPNLACALALLRSAGFEVIAQPEEEVFLCRAADDAGPWRRDELRAVLGGGPA